MSETLFNYPQPVETEENAPYLRGWRQGILNIQHCDGCNRPVFYPRPMCPHCWTAPLAWREASGLGTVVSFSLVRRPNHPSFNEETPIALAEIALDEGVCLLARVIDATPEIGMRVKMSANAADHARYPLPVFCEVTR